jgi:hypothetical protein
MQLFRKLEVIFHHKIYEINSKKVAVGKCVKDSKT